MVSLLKPLTIIEFSKGYVYSVTGSRYFPKGAFCKFDCWVQNLTEYGNARIKIIYKGPGTVVYNGLVIDYIDFIPYQ